MNVPRFLRTISYTPARQLLHRLRLTIKRKIFVWVGKRYPAIANRHKIPTPPLSALLPQRMMPHLDQVSVAGRDVEFNCLHLKRRFSLPINWHLKDLDDVSLLWKHHMHYFDYTENLDDESFEKLVRDYICANPPFQGEYWLHNWNSYTISIRTTAWMGEYSARHERLSVDFRRDLLSSIAEQIDFLLKNIETDLRGNHIIRNIKALYWAGAFFSGAFAQRCNKCAENLLQAELDSQILDDGFHFELSPAYHCQVFGDLMDCWRLMAPSSVRDALAQALGRMAQVTTDFTHPDGKISLFNDGGLDMTWSPDFLLKSYGSLFGVKPEPRSGAWLKDSGYGFYRNDDLLLICDAGRVGPDGLPAHAHGDIFAFELTVGAQRIFVDAGVFEYAAGKKRSQSRSTQMHNTVTLDNLDQCEFWSSFRMGRRANVCVHEAGIDNDGIAFDAEHDGYAHLDGRPIHRRRVRMPTAKTIVIEDDIRGGRGQRAKAHLLVHPDVTAEQINKKTIQLSAEQATLSVQSSHEIRLLDRFWWPNFGIERATSALEIDCGPAPGRSSFTIKIH